MGTFTTKLKLGGKAFVVNGGIHPVIQEMTVGQITVIEVLPAYKLYSDTPCYKEEYMCIETGVGGGSVYTYGMNIFATKEDAKSGAIKLQQAQYKEIQKYNERIERQKEIDRISEIRMLEILKQKYENAGA